MLFAVCISNCAMLKAKNAAKIAPRFMLLKKELLSLRKYFHLYSVHSCNYMVFKYQINGRKRNVVKSNLVNT